MRCPEPLMDEESARLVRTWVRLADEATGRRSEEGICDHCGKREYLSPEGAERLCVQCYLDGAAEARRAS